LQQRQEGSSPFPAVRTVSGSRDHPVEGVPRALTAGLKWPGSGTTVRSVGEVNDACSKFLLVIYLHVVTPNDLSDKGVHGFLQSACNLRLYLLLTGASCAALMGLHGADLWSVCC
jgi:hypothetical protein